MEDLNTTDSVSNTEPTVEAVVEETAPLAPVEETPVVEPVAEKVTTPKITLSKDGVVVYSLKNLSFGGSGSLKKGYSKVSASLAEQFLKNKNVRIASPEEVKEYFNK